jgi:predicted metalloprotease
MRVTYAAIAGVVLLLAGCGGSNSEQPAPSPASTVSKAATPDTSKIELTGDRNAAVNQVALQAIADLQDYWGKEYPKLYNGDYRPVSGGFYAVMPSSGDIPPCAESPEDVAMNAYYCGTKDVVAWDAEGLLPSLSHDYGDFAIAVVMAHEWGHAIQTRSNFTARTVTSELQADCFAGAWAQHAQRDKVFDVSSKQLDEALAGIIELRDSPGSSKLDSNAHGSGFDRVSAFQDGYDNDAQKCKAYRDDDPMVLELPFNNTEDEASGGDAPYDYIVNTVPYDLEDYWTRLFPELKNGQPWTPLKGLEPFDPANPPACGGTRADGYALFYCVPDDYIAWDNVDEMPNVVYKEGGDYAVATLLATQYGLAGLTRLGDTSDEKVSTLRSDCFAGGYTASVLLQNRKDTSTFNISPGDLDEAIKALLVFRGEGDADRQGAGFVRVRAFREGVLNGAERCVDYQP